MSIKGTTGQSERYHWDVNTHIDGAQTETRIEFLLWNDIVFESMRNSIPQTYWLLLRTLWLYVSSGALSALRRLRRAPVLAAMIEGVLLLAVLVRKFRFETAGQMPVPVAHLTVRAKDGIMLRVALRDPDTTSKRTL
ncbi:MAG: hypothetical protein AAED33_13005 [Paracoccaceae bacterium]